MIIDTAKYGDSADDQQEVMRSARNRLLADSDWTQIADNGLSDSDRQAWATYRQALRDFPSTWTPSDIANFPDPPA